MEAFSCIRSRGIYLENEQRQIDFLRRGRRLMIGRDRPSIMMHER